MKKSVITAVIFSAVLSLVSCSSGNTQKNSREFISAGEEKAYTTETTENPDYHERHDYADGVLLGSWQGFDAELTFQNDGNVTALFDISDIMLFNSDGTFMFDGTEYPAETVEYDGSNLKVTVDDEGEKLEILALERNGDPVMESFDGEYSISNDLVKDMFADYIGCEDGDVDLEMVISYGGCKLMAKNFSKFSQNGDNLKFDGISLNVGSFSSGMDKPCTFTNENDNLVIYNSEGDYDSFTKISE